MYVAWSLWRLTYLACRTTRVNEKRCLNSTFIAKWSKYTTYFIADTMNIMANDQCILHKSQLSCTESCQTSRSTSLASYNGLWVIIPDTSNFLRTQQYALHLLQSTLHKRKKILMFILDDQRALHILQRVLHSTNQNAADDNDGVLHWHVFWLQLIDTKRSLLHHHLPTALN